MYDGRPEVIQVSTCNIRVPIDPTRMYARIR